jgi:hypothetical protein
MLVEMLAWVIAANAALIDNEFVVVTRDAAPFAAEHQGFSERIFVALGETDLKVRGRQVFLARGDVVVFRADEQYQPPASGSYLEIAVRREHPAAKPPPVTIAPEKNALRFDGNDFFVFEERLDPGDTRARHSHSQRVVIQLNRARLYQVPDGAAPLTLETIPEKVSFSPPVVHTVENIGEVPLRGIIIEFKPPASPR